MELRHPIRAAKQYAARCRLCRQLGSETAGPIAVEPDPGSGFGFGGRVDPECAESFLWNHTHYEQPGPANHDAGPTFAALSVPHRPAADLGIVRPLVLS